MASIERASCTTCKGIVQEKFRQAKEATKALEGSQITHGSDLDAPPTHFDKLEAEAPVNFLWPNGQVLRVFFLNGDIYPKHMAEVKATAPQWSEFANVTFDFVDTWDPNSPPEVVLRFWTKPEGYDAVEAHKDTDRHTDDGNWSYIGTTSQVNTNDVKFPDFWKPTMNIVPGQIDDSFRGVIVHEFGHALGLLHEREHQRPSGRPVLDIDMEKLYEYYTRMKGWDEAAARAQIIDSYKSRGVSQLAGNAVDTKSTTNDDGCGSIRHPSLDPSIEVENVLSPIDIAYIRTLYPKDGDRTD